MSFGIGAVHSGNRSSTIAFLSWSHPRPKKRPIRTLRARATDSIGDSRFSICTADELHFVSVPNSDWNLALWRYLPSLQVKNQRNHPLLLLSGIATNAIGYDLSPECSFARYMSGKGFNTWILELRGSGLSTFGLDLQKVQKNPRNSASENGRPIGFYKVPPFADRAMNRLQFVTESREDFTPLSRILSSFLNEGSDSDDGIEISNRRQWLLNMLKETKSPMPLNILANDFCVNEHLVLMEYIRSECEPEDGKLHAIGHSMGGILLYSRLSQFCSKGIDSGLASITALASSLDYSTSRSSLKLLLPMADPIQALNVPAIPIGAMLAAIHPFVSYPPYLLSWLKGQVSAHEMMSTELYEKLLLNNFCNVPAKLLLQLSSAFYKGGLQNRNGSFFYKDHLHKINVPVLAIGGDQDRICPPEAVYETVKHIPENMVTLKILGEPSGPHYAHYDIVGSHLASEQVYPHIVDFLNRHDS